MSVTHHEIKDDDDGMRLDRWLKQNFPELRFGEMQKLLRSGQIRLDGKRVKANSHIEAGQNLRMPPLKKDDFQTAKKVSPKPAVKLDENMMRNLSQNILYEDNALAIINKPFGLSVQGGSGLKTHLELYLPELFPKVEQMRLVHRLDRDTSGVLVLAKTKSAARELTSAFRGRSVRKIYRALVEGIPEIPQGKISAPMAKRGGRGNEEMKIVPDHAPDAQHAVTYYSVTDTVGKAVSLLTLKPVTGRTHQLRVHMAHIENPIIGDPKYGKNIVRDIHKEVPPCPEGVANKLHLHAMRIVFEHPKSGQEIDVTAPLKGHFKASLQNLGLETGYQPDEEWDL